MHTPPDVLRLLAAVADLFGTTVPALQGRSRRRTITQARHAAVYALTKRRPKLAIVEIGRILGGRDHTTILHSVRAAELLAVDNPEYALRLASVLPQQSPS